jgi:hypothetical protein
MGHFVAPVTSAIICPLIRSILFRRAGSPTPSGVGSATAQGSIEVTEPYHGGAETRELRYWWLFWVFLIVIKSLVSWLRLPPLRRDRRSGAGLAASESPTH